MRDDGPTVREITTAVYVIPTDAPEADGTLGWNKTTLVLASVRAGAVTGIGWTYAAAAAQSVITGMLADAVAGRSALDVPGAAEAMARTVRNVGRLVSAALERVDQATRLDAARKDLEIKVNQLMKVARAASEGNLTVAVEVRGDDDMGESEESIFPTGRP